MLKKTLLVGTVALGFMAGANANGVMPPPAPMSTAAFVLGIQGGWSPDNWRAVDGIYFNGDFVDVHHKDSFVGRAFVGYDFTSMWGLELGYTYLFSKAEIFHSGVRLASVRTQAIDLVGRMTAQLDDTFNIYAKAGIGYLMSHGLQDVDPCFVPFMADDNDFHTITPVFGVGFGWNVTPNVVVDLSWTHFVGDQDLEMTSASQITEFQPQVDNIMLGISYKINV